MNRDTGAQRQAAREVLHWKRAERFGFRKGDDSPDLEAGVSIGEKFADLVGFSES